MGLVAHLSNLTSLLPGLSTMTPNTALCFVLCGASLLLHTKSKPLSKSGRAVAGALALTAAVLASLTSFEHLFGQNVGIDQLLIVDDASTSGIPGGMGPNTAACFVLLAMALLLLDVRPWMTQLLALNGSAIAMAALVGHAYSVEPFYGIASFAQMALHTAAGLFVLGLGIATVHSRSGVMHVVTSSGPGGILTRTMLPAIVIVSLLLGWFGLYGQRSGWYGSEFGVALLVTSSTVVFLVVMWLFAVRLNRSEYLAQRYLDTASVLLLAVDMHGRITLVNRHASAVLGWSAHELIGRDLIDTCVPARIRDAARREFRKMPAGDDSIVESAIVTKAGDERMIEWRTSFVRDDDGQITSILSSGTDVTERHEAEAQGRLQSAALNAAADGIVITDRAGLIQWVNPAFSELTGYAASEALGRNPRALVKSDQHDQAFYSKLWSTILSGQVWRGEIVNRRKDGSVYNEEQSITPVWNSRGEISHFIAVKQDTTERHRVEAEFHQRAQLSALGAAVGLSLANTPTLADALQQCAQAVVTHLDVAFARIWTVNERDGVLELQASAGLYTHLDGPHGRVAVGQFKIGRIARDRKPHLSNNVIGDPEVSDQEWARREGMVAFAGHPLVVGEHVVGVMALFARHALSEAVTMALASVADHIALGIERHRSADALRTSEERTRFALGAAGVGIWDMDFTTGVLRWSEILEAQYGLQPGAFAGTQEAFIERVHPDDRQSVVDTMKSYQSGESFSLPHRALWPDGTVRWLSGIGRVLVGRNNEPVRAVGISLDVTARHSLEERYHQAQKMEAIGRLAGGVAHDFNNLLTVILGYCELLVDDIAADDPRRGDIAEIHSAGKRAETLTRQLLAFSRKQIIEPTLLDLSVLVAGMEAMLGRLIGEDVTVAMRLQPAVAPVKADRGQVEQIVMNLAVNARDAMPNGGTLVIETADIELDEHYAIMHVDVKPGAYVVLTVADTGTGMSPEVQSRLFEPFFTTKEAGKGTGLGLATVHGIVARAGGTVGVYSEVGKGTSFKVYFPRADARDLIGKEPAPAVRRQGGSQTVLVVEDAEGLRELVKRLLERQGYTVLIASNADEALRLFAENASIKVILTDVVMPGASGPELTKELIEQRPGLKVIYMSGYTEDVIVHHGILKPGVAFLHKPFTAETLGRKIREELDR